MSVFNVNLAKSPMSYLESNGKIFIKIYHGASWNYGPVSVAINFPEIKFMCTCASVSKNI